MWTVVKAAVVAASLSVAASCGGGTGQGAGGKSGGTGQGAGGTGGDELGTAGRGLAGGGSGGGSGGSGGGATGAACSERPATTTLSGLRTAYPDIAVSVAPSGFALKSVNFVITEDGDSRGPLLEMLAEVQNGRSTIECDFLPDVSLGAKAIVGLIATRPHYGSTVSTVTNDCLGPGEVGVFYGLARGITTTALDAESHLIVDVNPNTLDTFVPATNGPQRTAAIVQTQFGSAVRGQLTIVQTIRNHALRVYPRDSRGLLTAELLAFPGSLGTLVAGSTVDFETSATPCSFDDFLAFDSWIVDAGGGGAGGGGGGGAGGRGGAGGATGGNLITLASGQESPQRIAVDATSVYWTSASAGTVKKVPIAGGIPTTLASGQTYSIGIAVDTTSVYWISAGTDSAVMKVALAGGVPTRIAMSPVNSGPWSIAVNASSAYWTNNHVGEGSVMKVAIAGGTPTTLASALWGPIDIALDATSAYWTDSRGTVMKVPLDGGTPSTLASGQGESDGIAVDAASVYWTNRNAPATVMKVSINGGTPTVLASGQNYPGRIAVDASGVYWTTYDAVMRVSLAGGTPSTLAAAQGPEGLALDASSVYWTNSTAGTIVRMLKP